MQHYALYLESRIRAYRELKHDAIRVQAETNRDMRVNNSIEEDMAYTTAPPSKASSTKSKLPQRSKTIMGRKLRVMTVEKGLLRETKTVQTMIDSLVECRVSPSQIDCLSLSNETLAFSSIWMTSKMNLPSLL